jgi:glucose-6-phosphate isomerase
VDFIALARGNARADAEQHQKLLANCLSQSMALMQGRENKEQAHRHYPGNRPSNTLLLSELNPYNLGSLIALYEHKVYIQSVLWSINAFDQWGVELGKELSDAVLQAFVDEETKLALDASSKGLIDQIAEWS